MRDTTSAWGPPDQRGNDNLTTVPIFYIVASPISEMVATGEAAEVRVGRLNVSSTAWDSQRYFGSGDFSEETCTFLPGIGRYEVQLEDDSVSLLRTATQEEDFVSFANNTLVSLIDRERRLVELLIVVLSLTTTRLKCLTSKNSTRTAILRQKEI